MPKVSVLMPVYNVKEEFLRESIDSILNQTFRDFEFLILDDCSTVDIESIVTSYSDARIKFSKNEQNMGIAKTRNKLMDIAQGEYLALMDNDDISYRERFEKQVQFLDSNPDISVLSAGYKIFPQNDLVIHPEFPKYLDLYKCCFVGHPVAMLRKSDIQKYDLKYDDSYVCSQDYELWSRAVRYLKFANLQEVLLDYRCYENGITKQKADLALSEDLKIRQNMLDFLTEDKVIQSEISRAVYGNPIFPEPSFRNKLFSVRKEDKYTVIRFLGIKVKIKRR